MSHLPYNSATPLTAGRGDCVVGLAASLLLHFRAGRPAPPRRAKICLMRHLILAALLHCRTLHLTPPWRATRRRPVCRAGVHLQKRDGPAKRPAPEAGLGRPWAAREGEGGCPSYTTKWALDPACGL